MSRAKIKETYIGEPNEWKYPIFNFRTALKPKLVELHKGLHLDIFGFLGLVVFLAEGEVLLQPVCMMCDKRVLITFDIMTEE